MIIHNSKLSVIFVPSKDINMLSLSSLLDVLNLSERDGLFYYRDLFDESKVNFLAYRIVENLQNHIKPDAFFCINNQPIILFFESVNGTKIQRTIWNFNLSPAIFINNGKEWIIRNGFKLLDNKLELDILSNDISDFEYFNLITGNTWEKYQKEFDYKNRVDYRLLNNIESARNNLINKKNLHPNITNHLIGRSIFIRYLLDRQVDLSEYNILKKEDFYNCLSDVNATYSFFRKIKNDFNGNLFPLDYEINNSFVKEESEVNDTHLSIIKELLQGGTTYDDGTAISSLFDIYDFCVIPIEFVSNVYEKFIGVKNQQKEGAYYTPLFLVDYIQKETVSKYFAKNPTEYNCKVLDPACGSGIFLVESLRQIILQYKKNNPNYKVDYEGYKSKLKDLLTDNIFGLDKDENAIDVAIFSLYITLLDNLRPKTIVGFKFPVLKNKNFFVDDFFNTEESEKSFNTIFKKQHFQFIIGNPPWATKHGKEKQLFEKYIEKRKKEEKSNLDIVQREIAEAFLVRVSDFSFDETAFIVVSKILYKIEKQGVFRKYFLNNFAIRQVVELSSVRHLIFNNSNDSAVAPASILFYRKESDIDKIRKNIVKHISLKPNVFFKAFKLMVIEKYDVKEILQQYFIDNDWAWKVFVYGNILDYYFIKRLKENYKTIDEVTNNPNLFIKGQGLKFKDGNKKISTASYKDHKFLGNLETKIKKDGSIKHLPTNYNNYVKPYYVNTANLKKWDGRDVGYLPKTSKLFQAPTLLITEGINNKFKGVSAILYEKALFKSSLTAITTINTESTVILEVISSILNSDFFAYYIIQQGSSVGIEREQTHDEEKWNIPFNSSSQVIKKHSVVEKIAKKFYQSIISDSYIKNELDNAIKALGDEVLNLYNLSNQEKSLVDYTNSVTIPLLKGDDVQFQKVIKELPYQSDILNSYAQIFIDHFGKRFNSDGHFFEVEIIYSKHTILMKFKVVSEPSKFENSIQWNKEGSKELLKTIVKLSFENLSDNLYLQKDIKGFEEDYFYIAKPNQYKSWHSALAYLDLSEFIDELHKNSNV